MNKMLILIAVLFFASCGAAPQDQTPSSDSAKQTRGDSTSGQPSGLDVNDDAPDVAAAVSFTGTWKTIAGGTHQYTVILKQTGTTVTGSYSPGNGKIFDGVVTGNRLTFKWTQDGGYEGTGEFVMDEDGKDFTGSSTALKPKQFTNTWNTYKPPVSSFAGTWQTITNGQHTVILTMEQAGDKVTGVYPRGNGKLEGTVTGKVLRFKWTSDGGTGSGRLVMEESGQAFSGTYNRGNDPDEVDNTWNGKRYVASFTGKWKVVGLLVPLKFKLQQAGDQVKGEYIAEGVGDIVITVQDGIVVDNTLRFKMSRADGSFSGNGEFVMDEGAKSFKGTLNGEAVTGTYEGS